MNVLSVTLIAISIVLPALKMLSFTGVALVILGPVKSETVKLFNVLIRLPLVSFAKKLTLYVPSVVKITYDIL